MAPEVPGGCKFAQFMADHIFCNQNRNERFAVVYGNCFTNHIRYDHRGTAPGFDYLALVALIGFSHFYRPLVVDVWAFFKRTRHNYYSYRFEV